MLSTGWPAGRPILILFPPSHPLLIRIWVEIKDLEAFGPPPEAEFRCGSVWIGLRPQNRHRRSIFEERLISHSFKESMSFFQDHFLKNISPNMSTRRESLRPRPKAAARARPGPARARAWPGPKSGLNGPSKTIKIGLNEVQVAPFGWKLCRNDAPDLRIILGALLGPKSKFKKSKKQK